MTPAERAAKIAELRAEADRLEREGRRDPIAGLLDAKNLFNMIRIAPERGFGADYMVGLACSSMMVIDERIAALSDLTIKPPDAPEPTGAELVGKVCEFSDDGNAWYGREACARFDPGDADMTYRSTEPVFHEDIGERIWFRHARLYREGRP